MKTKELKILAKNLTLVSKEGKTNQDRLLKTALSHIKKEKLKQGKTLVKESSFLCSSEGKTLMIEAIMTQDTMLFKKLLSISINLDVCDEEANKALHSRAKDLLTFLSQIPLKKLRI